MPESEHKTIQFVGPVFEPTVLAKAVVDAIREADQRDTILIKRRQDVKAKGDWYEVKAIAGEPTAELYLYGDIGTDPWADESIGAMDVVNAIGQIDSGARINARINSYGGSVADGLAIFNALRRHPGSVDVDVDGVAVSIASLIAMAPKPGAGVLRMASNSMMMIHAPWNISMGNANDHRKTADMLDKHAEAMAGAYARNGFSRDDALAMLRDGEDHWLTADDALALGLIDEITDSMAVAASLPRDRFTPPAGAAGKQPVEADMPKETPQAAPETPTAQNVTDITEQVHAGIKARNAEVRALFLPHLAVAGVPELLTEIIDSPTVTADAAGRKLLAKLAEGAEPVNKPSTTPSMQPGMDATDKFRVGAQNAILVRAGYKGVKPEAGNQYRGYSGVELARAYLETHGIKTGHMSKQDVVAAAFTHRSPNVVFASGSHGTSDFSNLLADVANKFMLLGYDEADETFQAWTRTIPLSDFKTAKLTGLNTFSDLDTVAEHGEFPYGTISDRGEPITLATYGKRFAISRQAIINDDLMAFTEVPRRMGRAAIRKVGDIVYQVLTANAAMADGTALFHADHSNLLSAGDIATATVDAMRVAMARQTDPGGANALNIRLAYLLVPVSVEGTAKVVRDSEVDVNASTKTHTIPNSVRGTFEVISDARLDASSTTVWYGAANPSVHDTVVVGYLDGQEQPYMESKDGWSVDGAEFKVRIDAAAKAADWRGLAKNPDT